MSQHNTDFDEDTGEFREQICHIFIYEEFTVDEVSRNLTKLKVNRSLVV